MTKFKMGDRVRLTNDNDGFGREGAEGVVIGVNEVRFDDQFGLSRTKDWFVEDNFANCEAVRPVGPNTYLHAGAGNCWPASDHSVEDAFAPLTRTKADYPGLCAALDAVLTRGPEPDAVNELPRFVSMWIEDDGSYAPTGETFKTLAEAEECSLSVLSHTGQDDTIAVFELRSVHSTHTEVKSARI